MFFMPVDIFGAIQKGKDDANKANWEDIKNAASVEQSWLANDKAQMNNWLGQATLNNAIRVNDLATRGAERSDQIQEKMLPGIFNKLGTDTISSRIGLNVATRTEPILTEQKYNSAVGNADMSNAAASENSLLARIYKELEPKLEEATRAKLTGQYKAQGVLGNNAEALAKSSVDTALEQGKYTAASAKTATDLLASQSSMIKQQIAFASTQIKEMERAIADAHKYDPQRAQELQGQYNLRATQLKVLMADLAAVQRQQAAQEAEEKAAIAAADAKSKDITLSDPTSTAPTATGTPAPPPAVPMAGTTPGPVQAKTPNYTTPNGAVQGGVNPNAVAGRVEQLKQKLEQLKKAGMEGTISYINVQRQISTLEAGAK